MPVNRTSGEEGFTMIMTVLGLALVAALVVVAVTAVNGTVHSNARDFSRKQAYEAAKAGIDEYAYHLHANTGYWAGGPPAGAADAVLEAERLGFDSIWTAEAYGSDCLTPLAWWGAATERLQLGTAIVQLSARQPAATAVSPFSGAAMGWMQAMLSSLAQTAIMASSERVSKAA